MLDPDVVLRADGAAVAVGATVLVRGADAVAESFSGRARTAVLALVDGAAGAVWAPAGKPKVVFAFTLTEGRITEIDLIADPTHLDELTLEPLTD